MIHGPYNVESFLLWRDATSLGKRFLRFKVIIWSIETSVIASSVTRDRVTEIWTPEPLCRENPEILNTEQAVRIYDCNRSNGKRQLNDDLEGIRKERAVVDSRY
jgi:hypothetical protein